MGTHALFRQLDEYYVLDFVAGRAVADAACYAPYGEQPSGACAAALSKLGGRWYAQLSRAERPRRSQRQSDGTAA